MEVDGDDETRRRRVSLFEVEGEEETRGRRETFFEYRYDIWMDFQIIFYVKWDAFLKVIRSKSLLGSFVTMIF